MVKPAGKQSYGRLVFASFLALLAFGLIADFLWASSHRFSSAMLSLPSSVTTVVVKLPPSSNKKLMAVDTTLRSCKVGGVKVKAVDTTGAGDAFVSGLLNSLASDLTLLNDEKKLREELFQLCPP